MEIWSRLALFIVLVLPAQAEAKTIGFAAEPDPPWTKLIKAKLDEPIAMVFPNKLEQVLQYIDQKTQEPPGNRGIPITIVPSALDEAKVSLKSTICLVDLEGVPLKTTYSPTSMTKLWIAVPTVCVPDETTFSIPHLSAASSRPC
jgi:hypothetical protein